MFKGALCMTLGFFFLAIEGAFLKSATVSSPILWALFISYAFALLIQSFYVYKKGWAFLRTKKISGYSGRIGFGLLATFLYIVSLNLIPFLDANLLYSTTPLFVPLLAMLFWGAKIRGRVWIFLAVGFFGVFWVLNPQLSTLTKAGNLFSLGAGVSQALAFLFLKRLTQTEPVGRLIFYYYFFSTCFLAPIVFLFLPAPSLNNALWALCAGVAAVISQFFVVKGYHYSDVSHVGAFQYTAVLFSGIIGWMIWNERPTTPEIFGAFFVILGGALSLMFYQPSLPEKRA